MPLCCRLHSKFVFVRSADRLCSETLRLKADGWHAVRSITCTQHAWCMPIMSPHVLTGFCINMYLAEIAKTSRTLRESDINFKVSKGDYRVLLRVSLPKARKTAPMGALEGTSYSTSMPSSIDSIRLFPTDIHRCWLGCLCSKAKCSSLLLPVNAHYSVRGPSALDE